MVQENLRLVGRFTALPQLPPSMQVLTQPSLSPVGLVQPPVSQPILPVTQPLLAVTQVLRTEPEPIPYSHTVQQTHSPMSESPSQQDENEGDDEEDAFEESSPSTKDFDSNLFLLDEDDTHIHLNSPLFVESPLRTTESPIIPLVSNVEPVKLRVVPKRNIKPKPVRIFTSSFSLYCISSI